MPTVLIRSGLAVCLVVAVSACASREDERAAATPPAPSQSAEQSVCKTIERFSRITFMAADRNHDGVVDEAEYVGDVAAAFAGEDVNRNYQLTRSELPEAPSGTFERINTSHTGALTFNELMQAKMEEFQRADLNKDGVLTLQEVTRFNAQQGGC